MPLPPTHPPPPTSPTHYRALLGFVVLCRWQTYGGKPWGKGEGSLPQPRQHEVPSLAWPVEEEKMASASSLLQYAAISQCAPTGVGPKRAAARGTPRPPPHQGRQAREHACLRGGAAPVASLASGTTPMTRTGRHTPVHAGQPPDYVLLRSSPSHLGAGQAHSACAVCPCAAVAAVQETQHSHNEPLPYCILL